MRATGQPSNPYQARVSVVSVSNRPQSRLTWLNRLSLHIFYRDATVLRVALRYPEVQTGRCEHEHYFEQGIVARWRGQRHQHGCRSPSMVKSVTSLWLRGLVRASQVQQRTASKLVKQMNLLGTPKAKSRTKSTFNPAFNPASNPSSKPAAKNAPLKARPRAPGAATYSAASEGRPAPRLRSSGTALPGKWLAACYLPLELGVAGRSMHYWLYLPDRAPLLTAQAQGWPLVVMLHGCEQTATQFAQGTRMNRLAERQGYAVLYPQQSLSGHAHRCWKWYDKATQEGGGDVRLIVGIIEQVMARYPIDRSRVYIGGISAGAGMANIVALNHPELIAAVGLHSGPVFGAGHNAIGALGVMQHGALKGVDAAITDLLAGAPGFPSMPTILIQGQGDKVVRPINQAQLVRQGLLLNRLPADSAVSVVLTPAGRPGGRNPANAHEVRDFQVGKKVLLRVARIDNLEHAWSGGDAALAFNARPGPSASKMMLDFFARHQREPQADGGPVRYSRHHWP